MRKLFFNKMMDEGKHKLLQYFNAFKLMTNERLTPIFF